MILGAECPVDIRLAPTVAERRPFVQRRPKWNGEIRMARKDRTGNRKTREQRKQFKVPELGYYLIVTDTEATERCFFTGLHQALPEDVRNKLVIKVVETKTRTMIDKCLELTAYDAQYRIPWIVFDRDQVQGFDEIIKEAEDKGIQVGWSNPCFEI